MPSNESGIDRMTVIEALEDECRRQREIAFRTWADARMHKGAVDLVVILEGKLFDLTHGSSDRAYEVASTPSA